MLGIDAIPYQSALLNASGAIVSVNEAWRVYAQQNGGNAGVQMGVGLNYLDICRNARGRNSDEALIALVSIERVLEGLKSSASFQYPCHSSTEKSWFICAASQFKGDAGLVLVAHIYLGEQRAMRNRLGQNTQLVDPSLEGGTMVDNSKPSRRELLLYQHVEEMTATGGWEMELPDGKMRWTPETFRIYDVAPDTCTPSLPFMLKFYKKAGQDLLLLAITQAEHFGESFDLELPIVSASRRPMLVRITGHAERKGVKPLRLYGVVQELITWRKSSRT